MSHEDDFPLRINKYDMSSEHPPAETKPVAANSLGTDFIDIVLFMWALMIAFACMVVVFKMAATWALWQ